MLIQEWIYLFLACVGFISLILGLAALSLYITERKIDKGADRFDFETRLHNGEILDKDNIF